MLSCIFLTIFFYKISNIFWKLKIKILARFLSHIARFLTGIEIHPAVKIGKNLFIDHGMGIVIGETTLIGDNVTIYQGVTLGGTKSVREKRHPTISDNVIIGAQVGIAGHLKVASGVILSARSGVTKDIIKAEVMGGFPALPIKEFRKQKVTLRKLTNQFKKKKK